MPQPPTRILMRTRLAQLLKIHPSVPQADAALVEKLCDRLCITDKAKVNHIITRVPDDRRRERIDIVFDYGVSAHEVEPQVRAYGVKVHRADLSIVCTPLSGLKIKPLVNRAVEAYREIHIRKRRTFPIRLDIRAKSKGKRLLDA